jgi:EAL domain-containing protein (putative c-di-GMP-specific phosphodiesterase class I)
LKIDRSFVHDLVSDQKDAAIVRSTIDLAHNLGLRVIAEGVESAGALSLLGALGCDEAQGFYIARPAPDADALCYLLEHGTRRSHPRRCVER